VLLLLQRLGLRPRRSVRLVLWTSEETGAQGARSYFNQHKDTDTDLLSIVMESDHGR
jgi:carboxypeptidase Q